MRRLEQDQSKYALYGIAGCLLLRGFEHIIEIQFRHSKLSVISQVSAVEGCLLSGVPLYTKIERMLKYFFKLLSDFMVKVVTLYIMMCRTLAKEGPLRNVGPPPYFGLYFLLRSSVYSNMHPCVASLESAAQMHEMARLNFE